MSKPIIGIDLGTTFSVIAKLNADGRPQTIPNAEGDLITPSVVLFDDESIVVGKEAVKAASILPGQTAQFAKREIGRANFSKSINGEFFPPEVIESLILEKLKRDAEAKVGDIKEVVITVPAFFNEPRRKATQDAGRLAGLEVRDIINEPTAAAIAYGVEEGFLDEKGQSKRSETILVYDLGGGTFDVSLMQIDGRHYTVVATDGNVQLGGIDWDKCLADHLAELFQQQHGVDLRQDASGFQKLMAEAEDAKRALSAREKVAVTLEFGGRAIRPTIARSDFEEITAHLLERTRFTVRKVLQDARLSWNEVTRTLLVGGSTRMPQVAAMLEQESGRPPDRSLSADEAVAQGAAIYAGLLRAEDMEHKRSVKVTNVNSHSLGVLGIEKSSGLKRNKVLIPRNTPLPAKKTSRFRTHRDGQQSVAVNVIEGGDASGNNSTAIGKCVVRDLPKGLPGGTQVDVQFSYGADGRLSVTAVVPSVKKKAQLQIERVSGLSDAKVDEWGQRLRNGMQPLQIDVTKPSSDERGQVE